MKKVLLLLFLCSSFVSATVFPNGTVALCGNTAKCAYVTNLAANSTLRIMVKLTRSQIVSVYARQDQWNISTGLSFLLYTNTLLTNVNYTNLYTNGFSSDAKSIYLGASVDWAYTTSTPAYSNAGTLLWTSYISRVGEYASDPLYYPAGYHMFVFSNTYTNATLINVLINFQKQ